MSEALRTGSPVRNVTLLAICQAIAGSNSTILISVAALTAITMAPDATLATLPVTLMILGTALATGPSAMLIHRWGRRRGFMFGAGIVVPAALLAALAVWLGSFWLFCLGLAVIGTSAAFFNQYRFAAADSVPPVWKSRAISWVLAGGVVAGFIGPQVANTTKSWVPGHPFAATYVVMAAMALVAVGILSLTKLAPTARETGAAGGGRSLRELLRTPDIVVPMIGAAIAYALMTLVMVAAPLAMVYLCGHTTEDAAFAIQWHVVAMFGPSFFTGSIVARIGANLTAGIGILLILLAAVANLAGITVTHFTVALILLGLGWNFGFVASTAMLAQAYRPEEAARVQGINEQVVFGANAVASISSGLLLSTIGWQPINGLAIAVAVVGVALLVWNDLRRRKPTG